MNFTITPKMILSIVLSGILLTGCGDILTDKPSEIPDVSTVPTQAETTKLINIGINPPDNISLPPDSDISISTDGISNLTLNMTNMSDLNPNAGILSGFSAYSALTQLYPYMTGETKSQFDSCFANTDMTSLSQFKQSLPVETGSMFLIDNDTMLNTNDTSNFTFKDIHSDEIVPYVNDFISDKTHGMISNFIHSPFDPAARAVILDTLYYKGTWHCQFDKNLTYDDTFYGHDIESIVPFMHISENYYMNTDINVIELDYEDGNMVMDILYDMNGMSVHDAFAYYLDAIETHAFSRHKVNLSMPKFETESEFDLTQAVFDTGLTNIFDPTYSANLSSLADDLFVSQIKQKAKIIVDEEGTEASAATMITMKTNSIDIDNHSIDVNINKPFIYAIKDINTNTILFAGYVQNID